MQEKIDQLGAQIAELDEDMTALREKKAKLAAERNGLEAEIRAAEIVANMSDSEKAHLISALGIESTAKVNGG